MNPIAIDQAGRPQRIGRVIRCPVVKRLRFLLVGVLCFTSLLSGADRSADAAAAAVRDDDLIRRAMELRKVGDDQAASPLLQEAYDLSHAPRASAQLGFCEQALGRWPDADTHLTEALKSGDDAWVRKNRSAIEQALVVVKAHIARVEIIGEPVGADVLVNAVLVGKLPLKSPIRVSAGEIDVELRAPGLPRLSRTLRVVGGQYQRIVLRSAVEPPPMDRGNDLNGGTSVAARALDTSNGVSSQRGHQGSPAASDVGALGPTVSQAAAPPDAAATAWRRPAKWIAWGLGLVTAGVGIYGIAHNRSLVSQFDPNCARDPATGAPYAVSPSSGTNCSDLQTRYESAARLGVGGLIGAAVFSGVGTILWLTEPESQKPAAQTAMACAPGVTVRGEPSLHCAFHF